jgi:hypothetical protein
MNRSGPRAIAAGIRVFGVGLGWEPKKETRWKMLDSRAPGCERLGGMVSAGGRDSVRRGLLLVACGVGVGVVLSIARTIFIRWLFDRIGDGSSASIVHALEITRWIYMGEAAVTSALVLTGCGLFTWACRGSARGWGYVATGGALCRLAWLVVIFALERQRSDSMDVLQVLFACEAVASAALWLGIGMAVRALARAGGRPVPSWAAALWVLGVGWDVAVLVLQMVEIGGGSVGLLGSGYWLYGLSMAVLALQVVLVLAARRALSAGGQAASAADGSIERGPATAQALRAADGLSQYRAGVIARLVVACGAVGVIGIAMLAKSPSLATAVGLIVPVAQVIAELVMLVGLVRYAIHAPGEGGGGAFAAAGCLAVAGLGELYAYSIAWRVFSYQQRAAHATSYWDSPRLGDLAEKAEILPFVELATGALAMVGALVVLASLGALARWLARRDLESRSGALLIWIALLSIAVGCLRYYLATSHSPALGPIVLAAVALLFAAVTVFVQYVGLLGSLVAALRGSAPVPPARVVSGAAE